MDSQIFPSCNPPSISSQMSRSPEDSRALTSQLRNVSHSKSKELSRKHSEDNADVVVQSPSKEESLQRESSPSPQKERELKPSESGAYLPIQSNPALNLEKPLDDHLEQERQKASKNRHPASKPHENLSPLENKEESSKDKRSSQEHGLQRFIT